MKTGLFIWQFDKDYPAGLPTDDTKMPMSHAFVKTNDGLLWMSKFDKHPAAVGSFEGVSRVRKMYDAQGIGFVPWGVIRGGTQAANEGAFAGQIAAQCDGLYMVDLEPYDGFWKGGADEVDAFMVAFLNNGGREVWLCPDTRQQALEPIALRRWLNYSQVTRVWPQAYWTDFQTDMATGLHQSLDPLLGYIDESRVWPVLPANATTGDIAEAIGSLEKAGYPGFALWRRGTLTAATASTLLAATDYVTMQTPQPTYEQGRADGIQAARDLLAGLK